MNKVYLLIIFLLISCSSNNKLTTKQQVQIKQTEITKKENKTPIVYKAWLGTYWGMSSDYKSLTISYTPNSNILKIESELYNSNKEMI